LSYRYVAPLADAGVPLQALGWMLRGDSPLKLRPRWTRRSGAGWRRFSPPAALSVNQRNAAHLLRLALFSQAR
jgi:D-amino-acid dehydrogenase